MTEITNISGGLLVRDLKNGETLRLNNKASITLKDEDIPKNFKNLAAKGQLRMKKVPTQQTAPKSAAQKKERGKEE